jgi:hypothetical protein
LFTSRQHSCIIFGSFHVKIFSQRPAWFFSAPPEKISGLYIELGHNPYVLIALTMEAVGSPGPPVNFYQTTRRDIPESGRLHAERHNELDISPSFHSSNTSVFHNSKKTCLH